MLDVFSDSVGLIYDAAADPSVWPAALRRIGDLLGGFGTSLIIRDMKTFEGRAISNHAPEAVHDFWLWRQENPFAARALAPRPRIVEADQQILSRSELMHSAYYNEYWRPHDMSATIIGWLHRHGSVQQYVTTARPLSAGLFERRDVELLELLVPHLRRTVSLQQRLLHEPIGETDAAALLDALGHAVILLDAACMPVYVNRAGERLLAARDGLALDHGRLCAARPLLTSRLDAVLAQAAGRAGPLRASGSISLPRASGKPSLALIAVPLRREIDWLRPRRAAVCVCIVDPARRPRLPSSWLQALFGLTRAEAAVAAALLAGAEAREIGERLGIRYHTVRAHIARIMTKTGTKRQAELVGLLSTLATVCGEQ